MLPDFMCIWKLKFDLTELELSNDVAIKFGRDRDKGGRKRL